MKNSTDTRQPDTNRYSGPGRYRIEVEGQLGATWGQRLGDLQMTSRRSEQGVCLTVLEGRVSDQAALAGVLNTLYELHVPLISVQRLNDHA